MVQGTKANIGWMTEHYQTILDWLPPIEASRAPRAHQAPPATEALEGRRS